MKSLEELKRIAEAASDDALGPSGTWEVLPLEGKYYGTEVAVGDDCIIKLWGDSRNHDPSPREVATWDPGSKREDVICDSHYETVADLATAEHIATFNPQTVLALLADYERMKEALVSVSLIYGHSQGDDKDMYKVVRECLASLTLKGPSE